MHVHKNTAYSATIIIIHVWHIVCVWIRTTYVMYTKHCACFRPGVRLRWWLRCIDFTPSQSKVTYSPPTDQPLEIVCVHFFFILRTYYIYVTYSFDLIHAYFIDSWQLISNLGLILEIRFKLGGTFQSLEDALNRTEFVCLSIFATAGLLLMYWLTVCVIFLEIVVLSCCIPKLRSAGIIMCHLPPGRL